MRVWSVSSLFVVLAMSALGVSPLTADQRGGGPIPPQRFGQPKSRSATGDALDKYVSGDYTGAISQLTYLGGFSTVDADEWIRKGGSAETDRRRLIAASLALEVTAAKDSWPITLIEWACDGFKNAGPATVNEGVWMRASVALAEFDGMWAVLSTDAHLGHALTRFPDDPHFQLARAFVAAAVAAEPAVTTGTTVTDQTPMAFDRLAARAPDAATDPGGKRAAAFDRAAAMLRPLVGDPVVGAEAHLRLGDLELRLGHKDVAAEEFQRASAAAATDPFVSYLSRMFLAWTNADAGRVDDAVAGYRAALTVVPHARSATTLLGALLMVHGRIDDAESLTSDFLSSSHAVADDPWQLYPRGDFRSYDALVAKLHEAIKR